MTSWRGLKKNQKQSSIGVLQKAALKNFLNFMWGKEFKNASSKIWGRQPLKNLRWYGIPRQTISIWYTEADHITSNFLKAVFHKFYLVHSWILWPIWNTCNIVLFSKVTQHFWTTTPEILTSFFCVDPQAESVSGYHYTAQLHSTKPELRFWAGPNPTCGVSEVCDGEDLWQ